MVVFVRVAARDDVPRLIELLRLGALVPTKEDAALLHDYAVALDEINAGPGAVLVAELDGVVVGMLQVIVFRHLQERGRLCAELESMHVHPDHRSTGIGSVLLAAAVAHARAAGCYRVQLTSNAARPDAHRFYERNGFDPSHVGFKLRLNAEGGGVPIEAQFVLPSEDWSGL
jgi:GNAT superfamily N-acetyltransferase